MPSRKSAFNTYLNSHFEPDEIKKKKIRAEASNLEIQLALSYETQGYGFLATHVQASLQKYKISLSVS
mgnify:CR=1 FL=1